jgi:MFS family permease
VASGPGSWARRLLFRRWLLLFVPVNAATSGFGVVLPLFILLRLGGSILDIATAGVLFNGSVILASIIWGRLADRYPNRRGFLLVNYGTYAVGFLAIGVFPSLPLLYVTYTVIGLLTPAGSNAANLLFLEKFTEEERPAAFASLQEMSIVGGTAGVLLGFAWLAVGGGLQSLLALLALLSAASGVIVLFAVERSPVQLTTRQVARNEASLAARIRVGAWRIAIPFFPGRARIGPGALARFRLWVVEELHHELPLILGAGFLFSFSASVFNTSYTPFLYSVGVGGAAIFLVNAANNAAQGIAFPLSGDLSNREGADRLVAQGTYLRVVSYLGLALLAAAPILAGSEFGLNLLLFGLAGAAIALYSTSSSLLLFRSLHRRDAGTTLGLNSALGGIASMVGASLSGIVTVLAGYRVTFLVAMLTLLASLPLWAASAIAYRRRRAALPPHRLDGSAAGSAAGPRSAAKSD